MWRLAAASDPGGIVTPVLCPSCGEHTRGRYCAACGEELRTAAVPSLASFVRDSVSDVTSVDSRLVRSLRALIARPGMLTAEFLAGRRVPYIRPLQLFLICNLYFFLLQPVLGSTGISMPLRVHLQVSPYRDLAQKMVDNRLTASGTSFEEYQTAFDTAMRSHAPTLVIIMVPILAAFLRLLYLRTGRRYVEHLVFSAHFFAFLLLLVPTMGLLLRGLSGLAEMAGWVPAVAWGDAPFSIVVAAYLFLAQRRAYGSGWLATLLRTVGTFYGILGTLVVYRLFLFLATLYTTTL